jgi:hypothetical protein
MNSFTQCIQFTHIYNCIKRNGQIARNEGQKPPYRGRLSSTNLGDGGKWEDQDEDGEIKNTLSFFRPKL